MGGKLGFEGLGFEGLGFRVKGARFKGLGLGTGVKGLGFSFSRWMPTAMSNYRYYVRKAHELTQLFLALMFTI